MSYWNNEIEDLSVIVGKTPTAIWMKDEDELYFQFDSGEVLLFYHEQDCCEYVSIDDVIGDWSDLIGSPLLVVEERTDENSPKSENGWTDESSTWTFYTFRGNKGSVDVRWYGSSNGYYSESVDACLFSQEEAVSHNMAPPTGEPNAH